MTGAPLVSVVLPAFDVAPFVAATVRSLAAQDWPALELVAADDGSTDETAEVLAREVAAFEGGARTARLLRLGHGGAGAARNAALAQVTGDLVLFMDADDVLHPGAVRALVEALLGTPEAAMAFPRVRYVDAEGAPLDLVSPYPGGMLSGADLIADNPIHSGSGVLLLRAAVARAGAFDPGLPACIDLDFWVRATAGQGRCILPLDRVLVDWRRRSGQITGDWRRQQAGWLAVADRALADGTMEGPARRLAEARATGVWAATAYNAGRYGDARRLMARAVRLAPATVFGTRSGRERVLACGASLLPVRVHEGLRAWYTGLRRGSS